MFPNLKFRATFLFAQCGKSTRYLFKGMASFICDFSGLPRLGKSIYVHFDNSLQKLALSLSSLKAHTEAGIHCEKMERERLQYVVKHGKKERLSHGLTHASICKILC